VAVVHADYETSAGARERRVVAHAGNIGEAAKDVKWQRGSLTVLLGIAASACGLLAMTVTSSLLDYLIT
jgi:hypothetical protein